jgi:hypothetical protein
MKSPMKRNHEGSLFNDADGYSGSGMDDLARDAPEKKVLFIGTTTSSICKVLSSSVRIRGHLLRWARGLSLGVR